MPHHLTHPPTHTHTHTHTQNYVGVAAGWKTYGATRFYVNPTDRRLPTPTILCVGPNGILACSAESAGKNAHLEILEEWTYDDVDSWGLSRDSFVMTAGKRVKERYCLRTKQCEQINSLVKVYVGYLKARIEAGIKVVHGKKGKKLGR